MAEIKVKAPTQKQMYEAIISLAKGEQTSIPMDKVVEFAEKKIDQLTRKTSSGNSKKEVEQTSFCDLIVDVIVESANGKLKCGEILKDTRIAEFEWADGKPTSSQRVSAMLKKMVDKGDLVKSTEKKDTFFSLASEG